MIPDDGRLHVAGGTDEEFVNALDFSPAPDRPVRSLFEPSDIDRELDRLAAKQQPDGGWPAEWDSYSPMAALEWRGWLTVRAVSILADNERL